MKPAQILQTVTTYMVSNSNKLKGVMPKENYFLVADRSHEDFSENHIYRGTCIDILAELIEKNQFFGSYVTSEVDQADNSNNSKIKIIKEGEELTGNYTVRFTEGGLKLWVPGLEVKPKKYMDPIRTREGFVNVGSILGLEGDLEKISQEIFIE